ncbi:MAG: hypothetical protein JWO56_2124 [Acidobacteria bacterium]|nr:hypothetical protein [Acidobacteriota bacterium]
MQLMHAKRWVPLMAVLLASCGSSSPFARSGPCTDLSGTYSLGECRQYERVPLTDIRLPDDTALAGVRTVVVEQTDCTEVTIKPSGRKSIVLKPLAETAIRWVEGVLRGETKTENGLAMVGFSRSNREWRLAKSSSGSGLTYFDAHDEHGLALLLLPYHERSEASCEWDAVAK